MDWAARIRSDHEALERKWPGCVESRGFKVYSQSDEDGIIAEIFRRIGTTNRTFVEFGAEVGLENNCRLLLEEGWNGLWIEGHPDYAGSLRWSFQDQLKEGRLKFEASYVDAENINSLISESGISGEIDLLSIDIDSNDYHVWNAINVIDPRVIVAEHNQFAPPIDYVMPYNKEFRWSPEASEYGSSIVANTRLANSRGYSLVAASLYSPNGFFVRDDLIGDKFPGPRDAASYWRQLNYEAIVNFPLRDPADTSAPAV